jgi:branched-chain amino acid transport system permease protein
MQLFIQELITGVSTGGVFAALALALVLVNRASGTLNFAQGEMAMLSAYLVWDLQRHGQVLWVCFILVLIISFAGGTAVQYVFIRPMRSAPPLSIVITTLGLFLAIDSVVGWIWGYQTWSFPSLFPQTAWTVVSVRVSITAVGVLATCVVAAVLLLAFFRLTPLGFKMRVAVSNRESAMLLGINVDRTMMFGWGLASALGAVAGVLSAPSLFLSPTFMFNVLIYALCAAALGGLDSIVGAVVGGLLLGLVNAMAATYIPGFASNLSSATPLVLLALVLVVRPEGLFGKSSRVRV